MKVDKLYQKETPTQVFSCEYCELFKNSFFIDKKLAAFGCSHQLKIFWERSASKFQGQQAAKFKYDGLYSATKTEIHHRCFCKSLEQLLLRIILGGYFLKEKRGRERCEVTVLVSGFCFFQSIYLLSHETIFIRFYKLYKLYRS